MIAIIILFIIIWIIVKAFSSNTKTVEVTTVDKVTGKESTEVRKETGSNAGSTTARVTLFIVFGLPTIAIILAYLFK